VRGDGPISLHTAADFGQLAGVTCINGDLMVVGTELDAMPALPDLQTVTGAVIVAGNPMLTSLDGLSAVRDVGRWFAVQGNDSLVDIGTLGTLRRFESISIVGNDALIDVAGLEPVRDISGGLVIANNTELVSLNGLENLTTSKGGLSIRSNKSLPSLSQLDGLRSVGGLEISGNNSITQIRLANLQKVDVRFQINTNAGLTQINIPVLATVGGSFDIKSNAALTSVQLPQLQLAGALTLESDTSLSTISANKLAYTTVELMLHNLPQLTTADFASLVAIGGPASFYLLPELSSFSGFAKLSAIGGDLSVRSCATLIDFTGLGGLIDVANMTIIGNAQLESFDGLESFTKVGGDLTIASNQNLPFTEAEAFASAITVTGSVNIN
jgi:hypothetical protein